MSTAIVQRLFALAGAPLPDGPVARVLARAPRDRLVRAVAWYLVESRRGVDPTSRLTGVRLVLRGWDDCYMTATLPSGAERVSIEAPANGRALVTRHPREGRGWQKDPVSTVGDVRAEIELAVRWLEGAVGCIVHEDCAAHPDLGAACGGGRAP